MRPDHRRRLALESLLPLLREVSARMVTVTDGGARVPAIRVMHREVPVRNGTVTVQVRDDGHMIFVWSGRAMAAGTPNEAAREVRQFLGMEP